MLYDSESKLIVALLKMVGQYCSTEINGETVLSHTFMSASEMALNVLKELGYVVPSAQNPNDYVFTVKALNFISSY